MAYLSIVIADPVRTAMGAFGGSLKDVPAPDLGAVAIRAAVERAGLKPEEVETAAMGNVVQAGAKMNPARQAAAQARRRSCPRRRRSFWATPMSPSRAAWRTWIRRLSLLRAAAGAIAWATA